MYKNAIDRNTVIPVLVPWPSGHTFLQQHFASVNATLGLLFHRLDVAMFVFLLLKAIFSCEI
jgi:hypothetical protein